MRQSLVKLISIIFVLQAAWGCSGYHIKGKKHLFTSNEISRLKIPLFVNRTIFPNISASFTNELIARLHHFKGLSVSGGEPSSTEEHVLIGVISSSAREKDVLEPLIRRYTGNSSSLRTAIGSRPDFFLTSQYRVNLSLEIIIIKNPLFKGKRHVADVQGPEVIFQRTIPVRFNVVNNVAAVAGPDSLGVTNYTNNLGYFDYEVKRAAKQVAEIVENFLAI